MTKIKSPLKDTGGNQGHMLMTKEAHINAHGGDAVAAGYEEEIEEEVKETKEEVKEFGNLLGIGEDEEVEKSEEPVGLKSTAKQIHSLTSKLAKEKRKEEEKKKIYEKKVASGEILNKNTDTNKIGSSFTNNNGDNYVKKQDGWHIKDSETGDLRLVNQKMFYENQLNKDSKTVEPQTPEFQLQFPLRPAPLLDTEGLLDESFIGSYDEFGDEMKQTEGYKQKYTRKKASQTWDIDNAETINSLWDETLSDDENNLNKYNYIISAKQDEEGSLLTETERGSINTSIALINDRKDKVEEKNRRSEGKQTVENLENTNIRESLEYGFDKSRETIQSELGVKYGNLGFTFLDNKITSSDNVSIAWQNKSEEEILEWMANNAQQFESLSAFGTWKSKGGSVLTERKKQDNLEIVQSEVINSIISEGQETAEGDLYNAFYFEHMELSGNESVNFNMALEEIGSYEDRQYAIDNQYDPSGGITTEDFTDRLEDTDQSTRNYNIEHGYDKNLELSIAQTAVSKLNSTLGTTLTRQQLIVEGHGMQLKSIEEQVKDEYGDLSSFLKPEIDTEAYEGKMGRDKRAVGELYIETDIYNTDGSIKDQDLYNEEMIKLEKNPAYNNLVNLMASQKNMTILNKGVTDFVQENLEDNWFISSLIHTDYQEDTEKEWEKLDERGKKLVNEYNIIQNSNQEIETEYKEILDWNKENSLEKIQERIDVVRLNENGDVKQFDSKEEVDAANELINKITETYNSEWDVNDKKLLDLKSRRQVNLKKQLESQVDFKDFEGDEKDFAQYASLINRNYTVGTQSAAAFTSSAIDLVQGLAYFGEGLVVDLSKEIIGSDSGFGDSGVTWTDKVNEGVDKWQQENLIDNVQIMPSYDDIENFEDMAEWGTVTFFQQAPQLAAFATSVALEGTGVGIPFGAGIQIALAASAGGSYYHELDEEAKLYDQSLGLYGRDIGFTEALTSSIGVGTLNYLTEKITFGQVRGSIGVLKEPIGKATVGSYLRKNIFNAKSITNGGLKVSAESVSEGVATMGENAIAMMNGDLSVGLWDNVESSMVTGGIVSSMVSSPVLFKAAIVPFKSATTQETIDINFVKINDLSTKLLDPSLIDQHADIKKQIGELASQNSRLIEEDVKRIDAFTEAEKTDLLNIESDNRKLRQAASEIKKDKNISESERQKQLQQITEKLNQNKARKQELIEKYPSDIVKEKYKHTMNSVKDQVKIIKDYGGPEVNIKEGNSKDFGKVLEEAGVDPVYQTRYGGLLPVLDSKGNVESYDMFINKETSLKDGMFTTAAHELLHGVMYQTLKQDNNTQEVVGDALLEALRDAGAQIKPGSDFNERINSYTKAEGQGEEIMAITSEALMKGEIVLPESALNKLGNVYRRTIRNKTSRDIEFNKPKDVLNFIKDYNYSIEKNMSQPAIARMAAKGITGDMVTKFQKAKKDADAKATFSRNAIQELQSNPKLKSDFDNFVVNEDGSKKYKSKEEFKQSLGYIPAYKMIAQSNKLDDLIASGVSENVKLEEMDEFVKRAKVKLGINFAKNFDPKIHKSLFGWLTGVDGKGEAAIYKVQKSEGGIPKAKAKTTTKLTPLEAINNLIPEGVKTQADYYKLLDDASVAVRIFDGKNLAPVIVNYIRSKSTSPELSVENIESVKKRLINFNPEATREDGSVIGREGFGEFIFANARFGKLDAAKKLYEEGVKRDQEVRGDDITGTGKTVFDGLTTDGTTSTQSTVKGPKARILENLSDVGLENMGEINAVVMAEVEALIEQNPKDLGKKLNNLIENEFRKLIVADMGEISQVKVGEEIVNGKKKPIYKVKVSGNYKAFHALEYDNISNSLSDAVIKKNYNNLYDLEQTVREKDKKVNPVTGKVTYPGKGIYTIKKANKAKWTKFFTEGGYTTLKDRQKKIATLIAKSKAKIAVDNYIAENSTDINKVLDAKLSLASENLDNQKNQVTSFDKTQFAKKSDNKTDNRKQGLPTKIGSLIEAKRFLEVIKKEVDALYATNKFIDKGRAFEQAAINRIKEWKIAGLDVAVEIATEKGGLADVTLRVHTVKGDYGIEMKYGVTKPTDVMLSAQSVPYSLESGRMDNKNKYKGVIDVDSFIKDNTERLNDYYNFVNQQIYDYNSGTLADADGNLIGDRLQIPEWKTTKDSVPDFIHTLAKRYGANLVNEVNSGGQIEVDLYDVASVAYLNKSKPSQAIEFFGEGLLSLNKDNNPFGLPLLAGDALVTLRLSVNTRDAATNKYGLKMRSVSPRVIPTPIKITSKAEGSILDKNYMSSRPAMILANIVNPGNDASMRFSKAIDKSRLTNKDTEVKGITVLDFDDTLATTKSKVKWTAPDGTTGSLNAEQYASTYQDLAAQGYKFDFTEFDKVIKGKTAPLFNKALKLQEKFGPSDMFILTARPPAAQNAIHEFLQAQGLDIPLKNITGLGNSTSEAKAIWMADKVAEGYNDFYFADDALQNVQAVKNMLDQFDIKSKVQQAKVQFSKDMNGEFNDILEGATKVESQKTFSNAQAKLRGNKGRYRGLVPASAQDFMGLIYNFLPKGKKGDKAMAFFKKALVDPFARGINEINTSRQTSANDYKKLRKQFPEVRKDLNKKISSFENFEQIDFTVDQAVRVYLWNKAGFDVPGLSARDLKSLVDFVRTDTDLQAFANGLGMISKKTEGYSKPGEYWLVENIASDLLSDGAIGDARAEFLAEWQQNSDQIFSNENLNKIEAIYGSNFREALEDMLYRMKTGKNRPTGSSRIMNNYMNWVNNSVGAIMFFNIRSAVLQTISATNYMNWTDNNPLKAAAAFANQKQFWSDFVMLFNSDYLKQRRTGNRRGVNETELTSAIANSDNKVKAALAWLLSKGFLPTQIADSFAIASGGSTFYRNRVKTHMKNMSRVEAEKQAFLDFQERTEVAQQSARPDLISQQQANPLGRLILAFQNTPMQYGRIMNKAVRDLSNRRGDTKHHISKLVYYGTVQAIVFGALQSAIFAALGDDDEEVFDSKLERIVNQMIGSWLSVFGYGGKAVDTIKSTIQEYIKQKDKGWNADHAYTLLRLLGFSPPIGSKLRKIYSAIQTDKFNEEVFKEMGWSIDNPLWSAIGNVVEGITNVPLGRISQKLLNLDNAMDSSNEWYKRVALLMGWNTWDLGIKDPDVVEVKEEIKEKKKIKKKKEQKIKKKENKEKKKIKEEKEEVKLEDKNKELQKKEKKEGKKDIKCAAISKSGNRCKTTIEKGSSYCTVHIKVEQSESGKEVRCKGKKSNKKRCKMMTNSKSGYCYYHD